MREPLSRALAAYDRRDWLSARQLFHAASACEQLPPDCLYALSDAAWWLGDAREFFDACELAHHAYLQACEPRRASIAAVDIAVVHYLQGDDAVGAGWIRRAQRLLEDQPEGVEHGYVLYLLEVEGPLGGVIQSEATSDSLVRAARHVRAIGQQHRDANLVAIGILGEGHAFIRIGRVAEGLALIDEAMVAVRSGQLNPVWAGNIYCHMMAAADELFDIRRARAWTEATENWLATMPAAVVFNGICRVHRSRVYQISGDWDRAEAEAKLLCAELETLHRRAAAEAHYLVGEVRRLRGDFAAAEACFEHAHSLGRDPQPGLARLRLAQGRTKEAALAMRSALLGECDPLRRAPLLAAQVEIALAAGTVAEARKASHELNQIGERYGSTGLLMTALHARGALLVGDHPEEALPFLREACRGWDQLEAPHNFARARVLLARAYLSLGDAQTAHRELDRANDVFERLGALPDMLNVTKLRNGGGRCPGGLTPREAEVLALVAVGETNRGIAQRLSISEKTVARHLSNIYGKLSVSSRTAAAAFAFEHELTRVSRD